MTQATGPEASAPLTRQSKWLLIGMLAFSAIARLSVLSSPTQRDEGLFGYIAQELLRGWLPLETTLDNKGVLLYLEYAVGILLGGETSIEGIRLVGIGFVMAAMLVFFALAKDLKDQRYALICLSLFVFHSSLIELQSFYYATELFTLLPIFLSGWLTWKAVESNRGSFSLAAGIFLGLAAWTRLTGLTMTLSFAGYLLLFGGKKRDRFRHFCLFSLGMVLASLPFLVVYAWHGKLGLLQEAYLTFSAVQVLIGDSFYTMSEQVSRLLKTMVPSTLLIWSAAFYALNSSLKRTLTLKARSFIALWLVGALIGFLSPLHYLVKQLFLVYPPILLVAACTFYDLPNRPAEVRKAVMALATICVGVALWMNLPKHFQLMRGDPNASNVMFVKGESVAAWLNANSTPQDMIYNWGVEWQLYFRSARRSPTRQVSLLFLVSLAIAVDRGAPLAVEFQQVQQDVVDAFEKHPPKFVIITGGVKNYDIASFTLPAYMDAKLRSDYELIFQDGPYWILGRKSEK